MYTNIKNQKKYIGIAQSDVYDDLSIYRKNEKFYSDIKKYGWSNFSHNILYENLSYADAKKTEAKMIKKYNTVNGGYNTIPLKCSDGVNFDYFDFATLNVKKREFVNEVNYFCRLPNTFIQSDLKKEFGLNRIFLIVYILIDRNKSLENKTYISIGQILKTCGYKITKHKPKMFYEIIKSILFLKENYLIETDFDIYGVGYDDYLEIKIIQENFIPEKDFTKLYGRDFDKIMQIKTKPAKENVLVCFLYILSFIGCRKRNDDGTENINAKEYPEAFYKSIKHMSEELSMSKDTISQCVEYLIKPQNNHPALLIKRELENIQVDKSKTLQNIPNIYVLNKNGYEKEIDWASEKIARFYSKNELDKENI